MHPNKQLGNEAEDSATSYLLQLGFQILERNYHSRFGEIDIIALKDSVLHFVEVKSGVNSHERINTSKLSKIIKTIDFYLSHKKLDFDYQIDAIMVNDKIEIFENVTL